ncbi:hypothetical protein B6U90_05155 [Thermoplasmatales archaeon ex4484_6]|nr:MAG: hypothetical protein B6U90_05155 [Thermoplasmatales archaeon ex4484_6]RLF69399.1 MAG: hypothetical protein DRN57_00830 [Thermoplasmata archaeon]
MKEGEKTARVLEVGPGLRLLGTINGLLSERELVRISFEEFSPTAVALHISPEELEGLEAVMRKKVKKTPMSSYEMVYARKLSRFGEVQVPSPALVEAVELASDRGIPVEALDMDDERFSSQYTELISGLTMIRSSLRLKSINRRKFHQDTPEKFIMEWDRMVNGSRGFRALERMREEYMAGIIEKLSREHERLLCILQLERMKGIAGRL